MKPSPGTNAPSGAWAWRQMTRETPGDARFRIQRSAANAAEARNIAEAFWNMGCRMAACDENETAVCVYAFREDAFHLLQHPQIRRGVLPTSTQAITVLFLLVTATCDAFKTLLQRSALYGGVGQSAAAGSAHSPARIGTARPDPKPYQIFGQIRRNNPRNENRITGGR